MLELHASQHRGWAGKAPLLAYTLAASVSGTGPAHPSYDLSRVARAPRAVSRSVVLCLTNCAKTRVVFVRPQECCYSAIVEGAGSATPSRDVDGWLLFGGQAIPAHHPSHWPSNAASFDCCSVRGPFLHVFFEEVILSQANTGGRS